MLGTFSMFSQHCYDLCTQTYIMKELFNFFFIKYGSKINFICNMNRAQQMDVTTQELALSNVCPLGHYAIQAEYDSVILCYEEYASGEDASVNRIVDTQEHLKSAYLRLKK